MGDKVAAVSAEPHVVTEQDFYSDELFSVGDIVRSAAFGNGEVTDVDGLALTINFHNGQTRKLNTEYDRLEKI